MLHVLHDGDAMRGDSFKGTYEIERSECPFFMGGKKNVVSATRMDVLGAIEVIIDTFGAEKFGFSINSLIGR